MQYSENEMLEKEKSEDDGKRRKLDYTLLILNLIRAIKIKYK